MPFDTVILGSGFAGILAARTLASKGRKVLVLEARDRTGGRARSYEGGGGAPVDLGCSWIHGYNEGNPVKAMVKELGIAAHVPKPADALTYGPSGLIDPALVQKLNANLGAAVGAARVTALSTTATDASLASSLLDPSSPLFAGLKEEEKPLAIGLARTMQVGLGATLEKTSLRWNGFEDNYDGTNAAPEGGYQTVTSALQKQAEKDGAKFLLNQIVTGVTLLEDSSIEISTVSPSGENSTHSGRTVICSIPVGVLKHVPQSFFDPSLSVRKLAAIERVNVGTLGKLALFYSSPWWPSAASSITILPSSNPPALTPNSSALDLLSSTSLVIASFSSSSLPSPQPTLLIYLPTTICAQIEALPLAVVSQAAHDLLVSKMKPSEIPEGPVHAGMTSWTDDPFCRGATTTPVTVGGERTPLDFVELGKPEKGEWKGRLGFAGEHTEVDHRGSVAGAVESGLREGERIAGVLDRLD
ncbi:hypothetical protein BDY24DRAFT_253274 [Mrakia frigida]|uniref:polyamine oxidase n=1 Tax=Mrakia frigida TaxID=29902 RepID=UPI003FCC0B69